MKITIYVCIVFMFMACKTKDKSDKEKTQNNLTEKIEQNTKTIKIIKKAKIGDKGSFLETLIAENEDFTIDDFKGKSIYVDNWATWCAPCMKSNNAFIENYNTIKNIENVVFVFVSFDSKEIKWREYVNKNFPKSKNIIHLYSGFKMDNNYSNYYGINALPNYFVIDKKGYISDFKPKSASNDTFISYLKDIM